MLVVSDLHGEEAALEMVKARAKDYDCVLVAGDIARERSFVEELLSASERMLIIPGNGDPDFLEEAAGGKWLHGKRVEIGEGLNLVGFGYSPPTPFGTPGEFPEEKLYGWMKALPIDGKTIFVAHAPPYGFMDEARGEHAGSKAVLRIMEEKKPLVLACGHIHEKEGVRKHGGTTVLKVGAANRGRCGEIEFGGGKLTCRNMEL
jgi:hypothetical protein